MAAAVIVDVGPAALPTWMYRAPTFAWFIAWGAGPLRDRHQLGQRAVRNGRAGQVAARAVAELHDRLVASDAGGLEPAKRELIIHDQDIERIQGRRDQDAHRQARAGLRIGELVKGWRGARSANYCCSHVFLRWRIGRVSASLTAR